MSGKVETHPVQRSNTPSRFVGRVPIVVTAMAYEVYAHVFSPQPALAAGDRGGFGVSELIAFLYARNFPRSEWRQRVDEALNGMENV